MKRERSSLDFHKAFKPIPTECYQALLNATRSVKEEKQVKRTPFLAVLIAAILMVITMSTAFAAQQVGWADFFSGYHGIAVPKAGEAILNATKPISYEVGPMTFTYQQLLADGRIALSAAEVHTTDGIKALYANDTEILDPVDAGVDTISNLYQLKSGTTWVQAAQQLKLPLYGVRALIEVDEAQSDGEAMVDALWNEDGSIVCFNMPATNPKTVKDTLPVTLYMAVYSFDPATGNELNHWIRQEKAEIPVSGVIAEKTYSPQTKELLNGMTLTSVRAEQCVTGVYLFASLTAPDGMDEDSAINAAYELTICDSKGNELPGGINLSGYASVDAMPTVVRQDMVSLDTLPDELIITDGTAKISAK
ncbi:MAG TPA: hypothetical protein PKJ47_13250 [Candidatus Limiplasma sp.]|nr:hypothetical protein [Candidatus Limiplasma sp.]